MTEEQAQNIVNAVWDELASRKGLDIQENVDNSDHDVLRDIYGGLKDAVLAAASGQVFTDPLEGLDE
ncbi:hypothetical protein [Deinococcus sp. PEB2-63]